MKSPGTALLVCLVFAMSPVLQAGVIYGDPEAPLVAEVLGTDIHTVDPEEMKYVILGRLQDRYAAEQGIRVSRADPTSRPCTGWQNRTDSVAQSDGINCA